jgi:hypothetical protein
MLGLALVLFVPMRALAISDAPIRLSGLPCPQYDLDIQLDCAEHVARVRQLVRWTNSCSRPATELVFNAHSHYTVPGKDVGFLAKMVEILRLSPREVLDFEGPPCQIQRALLVDTGGADGRDRGAELAFHFQADNDTALVVPLPHPVLSNQTVCVVLEFTMRLPQKQGRWGQWREVTFLTNWQPVLAVFDESGWHPTPFIPWHQPFFNEAGAYRVRVILAADQKIACTGSIVASSVNAHGQREVEIEVACARDFAFLCSSRYCEYTGEAGPVHVRIMAFPEHEYYAKAMIGIVAEALTTYSRWFGPYPYPEFTIAESYFGWNGNQCAGLVMIDERVFGMPHVAGGFVEYLVAHEVCHQWWYNVIGTNGYCETWMDEGMATYFSHRLLNCKYGKNNAMLQMPKGLEWLPNINRETYRHYGLYGTLGRGEAGPTVQEMPKYSHVINLFSMCYDRGSKIVGMIEERLGEAAFFDLMRCIYSRYAFRILRVADFQHELEAYTGKSWDEFFRHWIYGADMTDWCVEDVVINDLAATPKDAKAACRVTVILRQKAEYSEQTVLGFCLDGGDSYQVRLPIVPQAPEINIDEPPARIISLPENRMRIDVYLPCHPTQIAVDPDQILVDPEPANNYWKPRARCRLTPLYSLLDDTDLTQAYDRWNITAGPWISANVYTDPWYARSDMAGIRLGVYRTQQFSGGLYAAYRTDYRDLAVGAEGLWDHWPYSHTQVGINAEASLTSIGDRPSDRASVFGRYVFQYGDSLYLPPMHFVEVFGAVLTNNLPIPKHQLIQGDHFDDITTGGIHYRVDYLTPYWNPEGGFLFDAAYATGLAIDGERDSFNRINAQFSTVKCLPAGLGWLSETRIAARIYGGIAIPTDGEFFPLGSSELFRGFDLSQRQGSAVWVASLEWRFPLVSGLTWDCCDHAIGLRGINGALFYDVGNAYLDNESLGPTAHAVGGGIRLDMAWFSFVERSTIRFDVAKAVNVNTPAQFWLGFQLPF